MSTYSYNGVELKITRTKLHTEQPVYSDDGTELLWIKVTLDVEGVLNPQATSINPYTHSPTSGQYPAETWQAIHAALMAPRGQLIYQVGEGGEDIVRSPLPGAATDANNGPHPVGATVRMLGESRTWFVGHQIECFLPACSDGYADLGPIVSNRFNRAHSVDEERLTTIQTRGITHFRSDVLFDLGVAADHFRARVIPAVPLGFRRSALHVEVNPAGNVLSWACVDREMHYALGRADDPRNLGVDRFEGTYTQASVSPDGSNNATGNMVLASVSVRAYGRKDSHKGNMMIWCMKLAIEKLNIPAGPADASKGEAMLVSVRATQHLHAPIVDLHVDARIPPPVPQDAAQGFGPHQLDALFTDEIRLLVNDGNVPNLPNGSGTRGTYRGELFAAALRPVCAAVVATKPAGLDPDQTAGYSLDEAPSSGVSVGIAYPDRQRTKYSREHTSRGAFTDYSVNTRYETETGVHMTPVTGPPDNGDYVSPQRQGEVPDARFLTLHLPATRRIVEWEAERVGSKPLLPAPKSSDPNLVLIEMPHVTASALHLAPDGITPVWRASGRYVYGLRKYATFGDKDLALGVLPWTDFLPGSKEATLAADQFVHGIADDPAAGANA